MAGKAGIFTVRAVFSPAAVQTGAAVAWKEDGVSECSTSGSPSCAVISARNDPYIPKLRSLGVPLVVSQESKGAVFAHMRHRQPLVYCPDSALVPKRVSLDVTQVRKDAGEREAHHPPHARTPASEETKTATEETARSADVVKAARRRSRLKEISRRSMERELANASNRGDSRTSAPVGSKRTATPREAATRKRARPAPEAFLSQEMDEEDSVMEDTTSEEEEEEERAPVRRSMPGRRSTTPARAQQAPAPSTPKRDPELQKTLETFNKLSARRQRIREHMAKTSSAKAPATSKEMLNKKLAKAARLKALARK